MPVLLEKKISRATTSQRFAVNHQSIARWEHCVVWRFHSCSLPNSLAIATCHLHQQKQPQELARFQVDWTKEGDI